MAEKERATPCNEGRQGGSVGKRLFDVGIGLVLALLALPVIAVAAVALALSLRSWPFFVHERVGWQGRPFRMVKLRTLPPEAPPYADKYAIAGLELPPVCRFLRRTHLDELPQLLLVPFGRMSLVGPRPEMPQLHEAGDTVFAGERTTARPGCTGLWQLSPDAHRLIWDAPDYDRFYLRHRTLRFDVWILWQTSLFVLGLEGPVALDRVPIWACAGGLASAPVVDLGHAAIRNEGPEVWSPGCELAGSKLLETSS